VQAKTLPDQGIIVRADKRYRRKALAVCAGLILLGAVMIGWVLPKAEGYLEQLEPETALRALEGALIAIFLTLLPMGLYVLQLGRRIMKAELFPPPGVKVIADTPLVQGRKARNYGRIFVICGLVLISLGLFGALYTQYLLRKLNGRP